MLFCNNYRVAIGFLNFFQDSNFFQVVQEQVFNLIFSIKLNSGKKKYFKYYSTKIFKGYFIATLNVYYIIYKILNDIK